MLNVLDLFAGAGGFSLGLKRAGMSTVGAIEADRFAAMTFRHNFPGVRLLERTVEDCPDECVRQEFSGVDVVVGGPPCQGFSVVGPRQYGMTDERNNLVFQMARIAIALKPRYVLLENVRGLLTGTGTKGNAVLRHYTSLMEDAGYQCATLVLQALHFGVPQFRERVLVISAHSTPLRPLVEGLARHRVDRAINVRDAISDLPALAAGQGADDLQAYPSDPRSHYQLEARRNSPGIFNHLAMAHTPRIVARLKAIQPGGSMKTVPPELGQRERNTHKIDARARYKMNCTRLMWEKSSIGVPANFQTIHVHPEQHRMLTAREGARLQSFPDMFRFLGPRTSMSRKLLEREGRLDELGLCQYKQIGNAVPPLMAESIGEHLLKLEACDQKRSRRTAGVGG